MSLLRQHQQLIRDSAISEEVAQERGYWSATNPAELARWFGASQRKLVPALVIPVHSVRGELVLAQLRPDNPRVVKGRVRRYELPHGCQLALDVPPRVVPVLGDPAVPLVITEGARKADSAVTVGLNAIALIGVTTWRGRNDQGGKTALPDHELIAFNGRVIYLAFDSDAMQKREVYEALKRYREFLAHREADVRVINLPSGKAGTKVGLDDFLAAGHGRDDVLALASDELREPGGLKRASSATPASRLRPTSDLAVEVGAVLDRFVVLPSRAAALTISLFVLHTWAFDAAHATPYLVLQSAVKRSGKSRVEEVLELLVRSPWRIAATSESALFRKIDQEHPTLLLDEVDALFGRNVESTEPIRALLNAGNRDGGAVSRVVGDGASMAVRDFSVYCPKVLAGIHTGRWSDTVLDRSIIVALQRKKPGQDLERLRMRKLRIELEPLRGELAQWASAHLEKLRELEPEFLPGLDDRAFEAWEPLFAIAELAEHEDSPGWADRTRRAALILTGSRSPDADEDKLLALKAIRRQFDAQGVDTLSSGELVNALNSDDQLPFGDWRHGAGLDQRGLARLLRAFGISPHVVRIGDQTPRGYRRDQFVDSWSRYCTEAANIPGPEVGAFPSVGGDADAQLRNKPSDHGAARTQPPPQQTVDVADSGTAEYARDLGRSCSVADHNRQPGTDLAVAVLHAQSGSGPVGLDRLTHERRLKHWHARRREHQRELEAGAPTLADLDPQDLLLAFPGAEVERTDVDRAAEIIACALAGHEMVIGRWWPTKPIVRGLERVGLAAEPTVAAALALLHVQVQDRGPADTRWRLSGVPSLRRPPIERIAECGCHRRSREWRHATGGAWTCTVCHPPVAGLEIEDRVAVADQR